MGVLETECLCPIPKFLCWNANPPCEALRGGTFGGQAGHEGRALPNGVSALTRGDKALTCCLTSLPSYMRGYTEKVAICKPGSRLSVVIGSSDPLIWDFLAPYTVRSKSLLFMPPRLWYFCLQQSKLRQGSIWGLSVLPLYILCKCKSIIK